MTRSSFWFALSVLLACGGCAMRQQGYPEPRTQPASTQELDSAHKQIAELQDRITARRGDVQIITERPTSGDPLDLELK